MNTEQKFMTPEELDTIGEIMNISMGAAATAVSTMLERQVVITTPQISQNMLKNIDMSELEPAIAVRIKYVEGISGNNIIMLRRDDMRIILNLLMGNEDADDDDTFEFDEMSMSAASEVMNQMMGASATALSELLNRPINISTPESMLVERTAEAYTSFPEVEVNENVLAISFQMSIKETLDTTFTSLMPIDLTKDIVTAMNGEVEEAAEPETEPLREVPMPQTPPPQPAPLPEPIPQQQAPAMQMPQQAPTSPAQQQYMQPPPMQGSQYQQPYQPSLDPAYPQSPYQQQMPQQMQQMPPYPPQYMPPPYPGAPYPQYGMYQDPQQPVRYPAPMVSVKQADFPEFASKAGPQSAYGSNMDMLMGVSLDVSVVVGRTKEKIKNVLEFGQGTVIELDKQTGAPAEVIVNGKLLAYGDVVVVGDNFGIRITEIVGTKELLDSLEPKK